MLGVRIPETPSDLDANLTVEGDFNVAVGGSDAPKTETVRPWIQQERWSQRMNLKRD